MRQFLETLGFIVLILFAFAVFAHNGVHVKINGKEYSLKISLGGEPKDKDKK